MRKILFVILFLPLLFTSGCLFATLGALTGAVVRAPFEVTGYFLQGFEEGISGTYDFGSERKGTSTESSTTTEMESRGGMTPYRDAGGVLRWY